MPYASNADLPAAVRSRYGDACQSVFRRVFNSADGDEASKFKIAHTAATNCMNAKADDVQPETKAFRPLDFTLDEEGAVRVAFARLNAIDHDGDVTYPGAITPKSVPISSFEHRSWPFKGGDLPVGRGDVREDGDVALFEGKFFTDTTHGRDTYLTVKHMADLQEWSYGFKTLASVPRPDVNGTKARRGLIALDVYEISPVLKGAGETRTLGIKSRDDDDTLPAGVAFMEQLDGWLDEAKSLRARQAEIVDIRLKEGRKISAARLDRLNAQLVALRSITTDVEALIAEATQHPKNDDAESKSRAMRLLARLNAARVEAASLSAGD